MQLRRIEIRDFRKLGHVVVDGLEDGLNVIVGDNEAGKSTVLAALRAALFERHRISGDVANAMLPYNQAVRPEIAIDFEVAGRAWRLRKAFCQKPEAELRGPGERYLNDDAEERLATLLGFTHPGRGGSKPEEHQGIYGLCWVDQGAAHRSLGVGAGRESVASALESEVGQMVGGERGRALLAKAEERRNAAWTQTGRPRGILKSLQEEMASLGAERDGLRSRLAGLHEKVEKLGAVHAAIERIEREERLPRAVAALEKARADASRVDEVRAACAQAGAEARRAERERDNVAERSAARQSLVAKVTRAKAELAEAERAAEQARTMSAGRDGAVRLAHERLAVARAAHATAVDEAATTEAALGRRRDLETLRGLEAQLALAEAAERKRRAAAARAANISITKAQVADLERIEAECARARYQLEAASVRIEFRPEDSAVVAVDGLPHPAESELLLTRDASLHLGGFGTLTVRPGGGVEALAHAAERLDAAFADALRAVRAESVAAAANALRARDDATRDADAERKAVEAAAPRGLDPLRDETDRLRSSVGQPLPPDVSDRLATATPSVLADRRRAVTEARDAVRGIESDVEDLRTVRDQAATEAATLVERAAAARRDHEAGLRELAEVRARSTDDELATQVAEAVASLATALEVETATRAAADSVDPGSELLLQKAERAERSVREDLERQRQAQRELEVELRTLGRDGLGEQLAEVEGKLERVRLQAEAKEREGSAARLLHETLLEAQSESKDRWLGPVRERVRPYLRLIQPDTEVVLNEDTLELTGFVRGGHQEPFTALSVGAREQVAVITRLALAEILLGSGKPSAVILDDALVNTDEARLERMHLVLHRAARNLQILVLTCRERDFAQSGAPIRRMA